MNKHKKNRRGLFLFDDYCETGEVDFSELDRLRKKLEKLEVECKVPIIAHVKVDSMEDFFNKIKPCQNMQGFSRSHKAGPMIFLTKNNPTVDVLFLLEATGWRNICFAMLHDTATLDYYF